MAALSLLLLAPTGKSGCVRTIGGPNGPVVVQVVGFGPLGGNRLVRSCGCLILQCCRATLQKLAPFLSTIKNPPLLYISDTQKWRNQIIGNSSLLITCLFFSFLIFYYNMYFNAGNFGDIFVNFLLFF